ncbi:DUF6252 family protein [Hymenobacter cellulosivorans]|uniref:DUF6252 family protein n=1 Tax=Hymenobacter cellulosivorans TaxID=2932249 RepID=A0ABY4FFQ7_9BACT|nr:DUF6252 family protein [Hymenobacter cellulosivorans]UOQ54843.1 DUF6252 family protein [Hymenobacter cellulosivorans]
MKTIFAPVASFRVLLLSSLVGLAACDSNAKEDPAPDPTATNANVNEVHWKINGTEYVGRDIAQVQAHYRPTTADNLPATAKDMLILANDNKNCQVTVLITNFTGVGTYNLTATNGMIGGFTQLTGSKDTYSSQWSAKAPAGQFIVTEFDAAKLTLKGTFSFNARVRISSGVYGAEQDVTNGSFDIKKVIKY